MATIKRQPALPPKAAAGHPMDAPTVPRPPVAKPSAAATASAPAEIAGEDQVQLGVRINRSLRDQTRGTLREVMRFRDAGAPQSLGEAVELALVWFNKEMADRYNGGEPFPGSPSRLKTGPR